MLLAGRYSVSAPAAGCFTELFHFTLEVLIIPQIGEACSSHAAASSFAAMIDIKGVNSAKRQTVSVPCSLPILPAPVQGGRQKEGWDQGSAPHLNQGHLKASTQRHRLHTMHCTEMCPEKLQKWQTMQPAKSKVIRKMLSPWMLLINSSTTSQNCRNIPGNSTEMSPAQAGGWQLPEASSLLSQSHCGPRRGNPNCTPRNLFRFCTPNVNTRQKD